jgi:hypothetical protein
VFTFHHSLLHNTLSCLSQAYSLHDCNNASPVRRAAAMHLAVKEEIWLTLPQQIQFSQHLETTTKADTYILWGEKPSPQRKAYVATVLGLPFPLESTDPFF